MFLGFREEQDDADPPVPGVFGVLFYEWHGVRITRDAGETIGVQAESFKLFFGGKRALGRKLPVPVG